MSAAIASWFDMCKKALAVGFRGLSFLRRSGDKSAPVLSLSEYRQMLGPIARPSDDQVERFIVYVVGAHSWYKHLPAFSPGKPFQFYLNPNAGCELVLTNNGQWYFRERTESTEQFHYTWMTTAKYREQYGYLDYYTSAGSGFILPRKEGNVYIGETFSGILDRAGKARALPTVIEQVGTVNLTAIVDSRMCNPHYWLLIHLADDAPQPADWPDSTGGTETLERIRQICTRFDEIRREIGTDSSPRLDDLEQEMLRLLQPERERQLGLMRQSLNAMNKVIYE